MDWVPGIPYDDSDFPSLHWEDGTGENPRPWEAWSFDDFEDALWNTFRIAENQAHRSYNQGYDNYGPGWRRQI